MARNFEYSVNIRLDKIWKDVVLENCRLLKLHPWGLESIHVVTWLSAGE